MKTGPENSSKTQMNDRNMPRNRIFLLFKTSAVNRRWFWMYWFRLSFVTISEGGKGKAWWFSKRVEEPRYRTW